MHSSIQHILNTTKNRIQACKPEANFGSLQEESLKRDFISAVATAKAEGRFPVIAEIKPASPGKFFRKIGPEEAVKLALEMEKAGAVAISVLTEPEIFKGSLENLKTVRETVNLPVLRKDFIVDRRQLEEIKTDLVLLIAGILGEELGFFVELSLKKGFEPLVEVHSEAELELALKTGAKIIGINNRNLETLEIDLKTAEELIPFVRKYDQKYGTSHLIISESGIRGPEDLQRIIKAGADAVLVGSLIMENDSVFEKTKELTQSFAWR
jgi:indole-3-glycerol phosphate synthase